MRKVLIPKKDYVKELIKIIRVTKDEQKLRNLLSDYHEKDRGGNHISDGD